MAEIVRDKQTVTPGGELTQTLPAGVTFRDAPTQTDERGTICELFDPRWGWHDAPFTYSYCFTIRPGFIKGWGMHKEHEDRYFILFGEMEVFLYDDRHDSPTFGILARIPMSEHRRRLMNIPAGVWHADRNIGQKDVVVVNFPTIFYDHAKPDKYRLPLNNDKIPFKFEDPRGW